MPVLERRLVLPAVDYTGVHAEERALTLNSGTGGVIPYTYNQGRLSLSENRAVVVLGGYAAPAGWNLFAAAQKVEPITFSLYASGHYNISTGCKTWSTGYRAIYCEWRGGGGGGSVTGLRRSSSTGTSFDRTLPLTRHAQPLLNAAASRRQRIRQQRDPPQHRHDRRF